MKTLACAFLIWAILIANGHSEDLSPTLTRNRCASVQMPCKSLCFEAVSAEAKAVILEKKAHDVRQAANEARDIAEFFNKLADPQSNKASKPGRKKSVEKEPNAALVLTCATGFVLGFFSSDISRNYDQSKCNCIMRQRRTNQRTSKSDIEPEAMEARKKANEKLAEAYAAQKSAYDMAVFALNERLAADEARRIYEACLKSP